MHLNDFANKTRPKVSGIFRNTLEDAIICCTIQLNKLANRAMLLPSKFDIRIAGV
ncbi:hypothetical protein CEV33_4099 [Brucella grignonensis]|uniref:Uncharacterized protein n=1 Tax=Brucella grignonensis TaxID=94627 RepID=A0A256FQ56_9HYPH|nr:hypothetical protein CEV33_4099 [Brucella grignonensis]